MEQHKHPRSWLRLAIPLVLLACSLILAFIPSARRPRQRDSGDRPAGAARVPSSRRGANGTPSQRFLVPTTVVVRTSHRDRALHRELPSARDVAERFADRWLACTYHHQWCAQLPGVLPSYGKALEAELGAAPLTESDLTAHPQVVSVRVTYNCRLASLATVAFTIDGLLLELHPNLVLERDGWEVFAVPELQAPIQLPPLLKSGQRLC